MIVCYRTGYFSRNFCENPVSVRKKQLMDIVKSGGENQVLSIPHGVCPDPKTVFHEAFRAVCRHFCGMCGNLPSGIPGGLCGACGVLHGDV